MATDEPKQRTTAQELAQYLFSSVILRNEGKVMQDHHKRLETSPGFNAAAFEEQKFIYLVASIAVGLGSLSEQTAGTQAVTVRLRALVAAEMQRRWQLTGDAVDVLIEEAAHDLADLLFTDPESKSALPFRWALRWLDRIGVHENNPHLLFTVSLTWMRHGLNITEALTQLDIVDSPG